MGEIKSYKDLLIWQKGIKIVCLVYQLVKLFPKEELYALTSQLKRGSLFEIETQLLIANELSFIRNQTLYKEILG